jgi:hypothetical protein
MARKRKRELGPRSGRRYDLHIALVCLGNRFDDEEPKAYAAGATGLGHPRTIGSNRASMRSAGMAVPVL